MKTKKTKLPRILIAGSIVAVVALPASAASLVPTDVNPVTFGEQVFGSTQPTNGSPNLVKVGEQALTSGQLSSGSLLTIGAGLLQVPAPIVSTSQTIFQDISSGNFDTTVNGIFGTLGQLGLIDPATQSEQVWSEAINPGSQSPFGNPQDPQGVYDLQRYVDAVRGQIPQQLSQAVFGPQGQQALSQLNQAVQQAQQTSLSGQQGVNDTYQVTVQQAQQNATQAENVDVKAQQAQAATASQTILKAETDQIADLARIGAGNSAQLSNLGRAASYQSAQLSAVNNQLTALNERGQLLEVLGASQNYQQAQTNAALQDQTHYQQLKDSLQQNANYQSTSSIYIPGLMPKEPVQ